MVFLVPISLFLFAILILILLNTVEWMVSVISFEHRFGFGHLLWNVDLFNFTWEVRFQTGDKNYPYETNFELFP